MNQVVLQTLFGGGGRVVKAVDCKSTGLSVVGSNPARLIINA